MSITFLVDEDALGRLRRSAFAKTLGVGPVKTRQLVTTYFDTAGERLHEAGIVLALRRQEGQNVMSLSWEDETGEGGRRDLEVPVAGLAPDITRIMEPALLKALSKAMRREPLEAAFALDLRRTTRRLMTAGGDIIEFAIDNGVVRMNGSAEPVRRVILSMIVGDPAALFSVGRELLSAVPMRLTVEDSAALSRRLARKIPYTVEKGARIAISPSANAGAALKEIVGVCHRHLIANEIALRTRRTSEAVHQCRVALRRLRAALKAFSRQLGAQRLDLLADRARSLAGDLGPARDFDVFTDEILKPAEGVLGAEPAFALLSGEIAARRSVAWSTALAAIEAPSYRLFTLDLAELSMLGLVPGECVAAEALDLPAPEMAAEILGARYRKAKKLGDVFDDLSTEDRHEFRKELKKLRYPSEFFASLFGEGDVKRYFATLSRLQEDLGRMNDLATARSILREVLADLKEEEGLERVMDMAFVAGELVGWHEGRSAAKVGRVSKDWQKLGKAEPFWRAGEVKRG